MSAVLRRAVRAALVAGALCLLTGCSAVSGGVPPGSGTGGIGGAGTAAAGPGAVSVSAAASAGTAPGAADTPSTAATGTAAALLATLPVKGRAAATGYDRVGDFGTAWLDRDHDGCDTRDDVLARDLTDVERPGGCRVLSGTLVSPYTGAAIRFTRGATTSAAVQIDHVVALEDAWQTGAQQLDQEAREDLANDPGNLLAVDGPSNEQKGSGDAATWLPHVVAFRCSYVARQVAVKAAYGLWVTPAEHDAIARILATCPMQPAVRTAFSARPGGTAAASGSGGAAVAPAPATPAAPGAPAATPAGPTPAPSFANCAAVRAAGAAPLHVGDPGYSRQLDRDGDGTACED
ncbi:DUF1524 domain-containing protein [Curtobacterium sp. MCBD17_028]|uniref:GmrSD restriction endonuclease domain-containing protein n=1 Tax=Curtobacterium sp. MCBD17_028 TaxID=2175670 RepID=UPI000DA9BCCE|nr:DUF1524 domain-containing protein [Curtobacterium sp. MCBD17_028]PZE30054.1 hypothetical protein DEI86_01960 [Curtobacterium sp. MCBD17_028]